MVNYQLDKLRNADDMPWKDLAGNPNIGLNYSLEEEYSSEMSLGKVGMFLLAVDVITPLILTSIVGEPNRKYWKLWLGVTGVQTCIWLVFSRKQSVFGTVALVKSFMAFAVLFGDATYCGPRH